MKKADPTEFKSYSSLVFMLAVLALPGSARTSPISVAITGTVRIVDDSNNILGGSVVSGDTVTGVYTYDSATPDSNSIPEVGDYWHTSAPFGISLTVNGLTFRTDPDNVSFLVEIVNDYAPGTPPTDNYVLHSYNNIFAVSAPAGMFGGTSMDLISWQLDDPTATALSSPDLPATPPVLADWQSTFGLDISSMGDFGEMFLIRSDITSAVLIEPDGDGDGVPDSEDQCPGTPVGAIVDAHGCSIEQLAPCVGPRSGGVWENHGQFVSAVNAAAEAFQGAGLISDEQKDSIVENAAKSDCGK